MGITREQCRCDSWSCRQLLLNLSFNSTTKYSLTHLLHILAELYIALCASWHHLDNLDCCIDILPQACSCQEQKISFYLQFPLYQLLFLFLIRFPHLRYYLHTNTREPFHFQNCSVWKSAKLQSISTKIQSNQIKTK